MPGWGQVLGAQPSPTDKVAGLLEVTLIKIREYFCPANLPNCPFVPTAHYKHFARIVLHGVMVTSEEAPYVQLLAPALALPECP